MGDIPETGVERNWLAGVLDDIERYARDNDLALLLDKVRSARIAASLDAGIKRAPVVPVVVHEGQVSLADGAGSAGTDDPF